MDTGAPGIVPLRVWLPVIVMAVLPDNLGSFNYPQADLE